MTGGLTLIKYLYIGPPGTILSLDGGQVLMTKFWLLSDEVSTILPLDVRAIKLFIPIAATVPIDGPGTTSLDSKSLSVPEIVGVSLITSILISLMEGKK